jgi:multidrug resistance efflux pump
MVPGCSRRLARSPAEAPRLLKELAMKLRVIPGCRPPHACKDSAFRISTALLSAACLLWPVSVLTGCDRSTSAAVSGVIEAHRVTVSAELGGRILSVSTQEGAVVQAGDVLLTLDCVVTQAQLDQARAALAQATAQVEQTVAQQQLIADGARPQEIEAAQADVTSAEQALRMGRRGATRDQRAQLEAALEGVRARQALAQATVLRLDTLTVAGSSTEAQRDAANTELAVLNAEEQRLLAALAEAESGARPEEAAILEQRLQQAQARLSALQEGARAQIGRAHV